MNRQYTILILLTVLTGLPLHSAIETAESVREVSFQKYVEPAFPNGLNFDGVTKASVDIAVDINEDGTLADWMPLRSTDPRFTREIERVIDQWVFSPVIREGEAVPVIFELRFQFTRSGIVVSAGDLTQIFLNELTSRMKDNRLVYDLVDLDKIPEPVEVVQPGRWESLPPDKAEGTVIVDFIIDTKGQVRLPVVNRIDGPIELGYAAYHALRQWHFEPPVRGGKIVPVHARQRFIFTPDQE